MLGTLVVHSAWDQFAARKPVLVFPGHIRGRRHEISLAGRSILLTNTCFEHAVALALGVQNPCCVAAEAEEEFLRLPPELDVRIQHRIVICRLRQEFSNTFQPLLGQKAGLQILRLRHGKYHFDPAIRIKFAPGVLRLADCYVDPQLKARIQRNFTPRAS